MADTLALRTGRRARGASAQDPARRAPAAECSVGIMAYNEEANIGHTIRSVLASSASSSIRELVVVASGCTDGTADVVAALARDDRRIRLLTQERREGKASAINLFIANARSPVLVMLGADVLVEEDTVAALLKHFEDPEVGMVGGHPIPVNDERTFMGFAVHLQWRLHDRVALSSPKLGEIVAFRSLVPSIPTDTAVDEISIQALISQLGYRLVYEPQAVVYNRGPATMADFLRQRRRIHAGHLRIRGQQGYEPSTMNPWVILGLLPTIGAFATLRLTWWTFGVIGLEGVARALAHYDVRRRHSHHIWEMVASTKQEIADSAPHAQRPNVVVFHVMDLARYELQLGARASARLVDEVVVLIKKALGPLATVTPQQSAVIVALMPGSREEVERAVAPLIERRMRVVVAGHQGGLSIELACGIISFDRMQQPASDLVPVPMAADSASQRSQT